MSRLTYERCLEPRHLRVRQCIPLSKPSLSRPSRGELPGDPDRRTHHLGLRGDVVSHDDHLPGVERQQRGQHVHGRGFPGAVGARRGRRWFPLAHAGRCREHHPVAEGMRSPVAQIAGGDWVSWFLVCGVELRRTARRATRGRWRCERGGSRVAACPSARAPGSPSSACGRRQGSR
jgi:hypothetical protein